MNPLPPIFKDWFLSRGWDVHPHQQAMLDQSMDPALMLIAPTGGGKTLGGFLPSLIELADGGFLEMRKIRGKYCFNPAPVLEAKLKRAR